MEKDSIGENSLIVITKGDKEFLSRKVRDFLDF
jgi:hypothetical protein